MALLSFFPSFPLATLLLGEVDIIKGLRLVLKLAGGKLISFEAADTNAQKTSSYK